MHPGCEMSVFLELRILNWLCNLSKGKSRKWAPQDPPFLLCSSQMSLQPLGEYVREKKRKKTENQRDRLTGNPWSIAALTMGSPPPEQWEARGSSRVHGRLKGLGDSQNR